MNTGLRRFLLRLAVGLLAFMLGITAAWALGSFNPFRNSSGMRYNYRYQRYDSTGEATTMPAFDHPRYHKRDKCRARGELGTLPPAPLVDAPLPPTPPPSAFALEYKVGLKFL